MLSASILSASPPTSSFVLNILILCVLVFTFLVVRNILLTFGGYWYEDNRKKITNWRNSENLAGTVSFEPRRVPKVSYDDNHYDLSQEMNFLMK